MRSKLRAALHLGSVISTLLAISCSKSTEAVSRQDQEKMFREALGFAPPEAVTQINCTDVYNRYLTDGAYGQWMRFTYTEEVFTRILKDKAYPQPLGGRYGDLESEAQPKWWPDVDETKIKLYSKGHEDTKESEGFSFREYIWHDKSSNFVYFHKRYWD